MKFLPTITTTNGSNWKEKLKEIKNFGLTEVALFPTCLNEEERKELYSEILKTPIRQIPLVHLRSDMKLSELEYLIKKYDTQIFNAHSEKAYPIDPDWKKYHNIICLENTPRVFLNEEEIKNWGGICLDFSHLENDLLLNEEKYNSDIAIIDKYPIRCNHISAVKEKFFLDEQGKMQYTSHTLNNRSELDYLKKYPFEYFSDFCAIELDNRIADQLEAIEYIKTLLQGRDSQIKDLGF
ncbi:MAG: hypothetical protein WC534_03290 [Candidatus Paceibacterota bacterium]